MIEDPVSASKLKFVFPDIVNRWNQVRDAMWDDHGKQIRVTEAFRSYEQQWATYALGRKKNQGGVWVIVEPKKVVTHARAGESFHQFGLAIDSCFMGDDPYLSKLHKFDCDNLWKEYGTLCKKFGLEWGGDWPGPKADRPHCQLAYGLSIHTVQMIFEKGGIKGVWDRCKQNINCGGEIE